MKHLTTKALLTTALLVATSAVLAQQVIEVNEEESIQQAINQASNGDTIKVAKGTYDESLLVNKSVILEGESTWETFITGGENGNAQAYNEGRTILVYAQSAIIDGFTITQSSSDVDANHNSMAILLEAAGSSTIRNCRISNHLTGIYISGSNNNVIEENIIERCGNGILFAAHMFNSSSNMIENNKIRDNGVAEESDDAGVKLITNYEGNANRIVSNDIENNTIGINNLTTNSIDARGNWWGEPTGPINEANPSGNGNSVSGFVIFQGWFDVPVTPLSVEEPKVIQLSEAKIYPNPASTQATISFELQSSAMVGVRVINLRGEEVYLQSPTDTPSGLQEIVLKTDEMSAGIYLVNLLVNGTSSFARLVVE